MKNLTAILPDLMLFVLLAAMGGTTQAAGLAAAQSGPAPADGVGLPDYSARPPVPHPGGSNPDAHSSKKSPSDPEANSTDQTVLILFGLMAFAGLIALAVVWIQARRAKMHRNGHTYRQRSSI